WRFRPGQRVRLKVPVEKFEDKFVLPAGAGGREGAEADVFRPNGDLFGRKPVPRPYEDRETVVLDTDGGIAAGAYVAHNGAAALNPALRAQMAGGEGGHEGHAPHGHSHDH